MDRIGAGLLINGYSLLARKKSRHPVSAHHQLSNLSDEGFEIGSSGYFGLGASKHCIPPIRSIR